MSLNTVSNVYEKLPDNRLTRETDIEELQSGFRNRGGTQDK